MAAAAAQQASYCQPSIRPGNHDRLAAEIRLIPAVDLRETFGATVDGLLLAMQYASQAMQQRPPDAAHKFAIVNISSTAALATMSGMTAYSAAKATIRSLSRSAALELAPWNIR